MTFLINLILLPLNLKSAQSMKKYADFQKKCLGRMKDVSVNDGRTVLFVSHNMEAVLKLCNNAVCMNKGMIKYSGKVGVSVSSYLTPDLNQIESVKLISLIRLEYMNLGRRALFSSILLRTNSGNLWKAEYKEELNFEISLIAYEELKNIEVGVAIYSISDLEIISSLSSDNNSFYDITNGEYTFLYSIVNLKLLPGTYRVALGLRSERGFEDYLTNVCEFEILISNESAIDKTNSRRGFIVPDIKCSLNKIST